MASPTRSPRSAPAIRPPVGPPGRRGPQDRRRPDTDRHGPLRPTSAPRPRAADRLRRALRAAFATPPRPGPGGPGAESAGRVLAVFSTALALAALVNADALVERAERKPLGDDRDRSLAIWHPVQDISHVLQLHRIRDVADAVTGNDDPHRGGALAPDERAAGGSEPATPTTPTVTLPPRPEVRTPTATAPLRVWVGGDSMMRDLSESIERLAVHTPLLHITTHYEISSGLSRPDYFDWPAALAQETTELDTEVVVVMFGANDGQGIVAPDGTVHQRVAEPGWQQEYSRRVGALMDQLRAEERIVLWVLQPPMSDGDFNARMQIVNSIYRAAAETRPWVELVDTTPLFATTDGGFSDRLPGPDGNLLDLRQDDGIHLAREGADLLASHLLALISGEFAAAASEPTTSATDPTPTTTR